MESAVTAEGRRNAAAGLSEAPQQLLLLGMLTQQAQNAC